MKTFLFIFLLGTVAHAQYSTKKVIIKGNGAELPNAASKEISGGHSAPQAAVGEFIQVLNEFLTTN